MGSLVFVHGIGVRALPEGGAHPYDVTCRAIGWELTLKQIDWTLVKCLWGDDLGARLLGGEKSLPPISEKLAPAAKPDDPAGVWEVLLDDPGFELRALAAVSAAAGPNVGNAPAAPLGHAPPGGPPGKSVPAWVELQARLATFEPEGRLGEQLDRFALKACFARAVRDVHADSTTQALIQDPQAFRAIARAMVARTVRQAMRDGIPPPGRTDLDMLVEQVEQALRKGELFGVPDWVKTALSSWATTKAERKRAALAAAATPLAGDVILYQAHGDRIRQRIRDVVMNDRTPEPVVILAHSLGGVASTEALCEEAAMRRRVRGLITAGSQPGFFYEIDALRTLPYGEPLPDDFPDWLSFWDPRDFLSFVTKDVFSGGRTRTDVKVESGLPFPASHSGYWRQSELWQHIKHFLEKL